MVVRGGRGVISTGQPRSYNTGGDGDKTGPSVSCADLLRGRRRHPPGETGRRKFRSRFVSEPWNEPAIACTPRCRVADVLRSR
jgi:hypothetical protein